MCVLDDTAGPDAHMREQIAAMDEPPLWQS